MLRKEKDRIEETETPAAPLTEAGVAQVVLDGLQHTPFGFALFNRDQELVYFNKRFQDLLESETGILEPGMPLERIESQFFQGTSGQAQELGLTAYREHETHSGRLVACNCQETGDGGIAVSVRDVTADRAADRVLRESEARFRDLTETASDWFWEMDRDLKITFISNRFYYLTDIPASELIGTERGASPYTVPGQEETFRENMEQMRRRKTYRDFRFEVRGRDGRVRVLSVNGAPFYDTKGVFSGYRGTGRDITELERLAKAFATRQAQIQELMEHAPIPIFFKDTDLRYVIANEAFYEERDLTPEQVIGKRVDEIFTGAAGVDYLEHDRIVTTSGEPVMREQNVGSIIIRSYKFPILDEEGKLLGLGGVELDITDRIRESQALIAAKSEAERASKAKSFFLAKVSHELRTPLNAVIGFGEVLQAEVFGPLGTPRYGEYATDIVSSGRHLLGLVSDILDISKIESDELELHEENLDLSALVERTIGVTHAAQPHAHAQILTEHVEKDIHLYADETALERILMNLIGNALKFTETDGQVDVVLSRDPENRVNMIIRDTGIGIAKERLQEVIQPFSTGANPLHLGYEGAGLGLAIVKALCDAHDAVFTIHSEEDVGTVCMVSFPANRSR